MAFFTVDWLFEQKQYSHLPTMHSVPRASAVKIQINTHSPVTTNNERRRISDSTSAFIVVFRQSCVDTGHRVAQRASRLHSSVQYSSFAQSNHNCRFKLYLNQRVIDSCDVQGSRLRHQFCPRRDNRLWFASAFRLLRLGCGLSKLVCDTILTHLAVFDESIIDGGPAQLIEKRRQCGIDFLQPLYMDYLMQNQYAHCIYDMLEISIECTAECDCVFIADEYNLTDTPRLDECNPKDLGITWWDNYRFEGPTMSPCEHVFDLTLPATGFVDAILFVFQLDTARNTVAPFQRLYMYFNGHCMFSATAEQLQLISDRHDLFALPLPPPFTEQIDAVYPSMSGAVLTKLGTGTWQCPTKGCFLNSVFVDFRLEGVHWFRSLTIYAQRRGKAQ